MPSIIAFFAPSARTPTGSERLYSRCHRASPNINAQSRTEMPAKSFRELVGAVPSTATTTDSVLVIIDAQNEYAEGALAVSSLATSRPAIAGLLQRYRAAGGAVAHVVHIVPSGAPVFMPDTPLAAEFAELQPPSGSSTEFVVPKRFPGSFAETILQSEIEKTGLRKVVLVGYMAHVCVSTTAREAAQRGYQVLVVEDAIGDRDIPGASGADVTKMVLLELADAFATIVKSSDIQ
ncbi:isochorismatase family hydrolase [Mycena maculata]|uniref:Isochorismatase family hydrolase n=1 Tax=Mycena maculata TaxID=230809 RepID=A0AAD7NGQ1_9AGAR|nr:isochorismatase family hydrolase [Mycena maculata]